LDGHGFYGSNVPLFGYQADIGHLREGFGELPANQGDAGPLRVGGLRDHKNTKPRAVGRNARYFVQLGWV
jgi:hypothetical protein